jgi:hypothetical protein
MATVYLTQFGDGRILSTKDGRELNHDQCITYSNGMCISDIVSLLDLSAEEHVDVYDVFGFSGWFQQGDSAHLPLNSQVSDLVTNNEDTLRAWSDHGYPLDAVYLFIRLSK